MNLILLDKNDEGRIHLVKFPLHSKGTTGNALEFHLWNRKDKSSEFTATDIEINCVSYDKTTTLTTDYKGWEIVNENLVECKSTGVIGTGIIDDNNSSYTAIGKVNHLHLGDIPVNCARKIFFRLKTISGNSTENALFFIKIKYNYIREKVLANTQDISISRLIFPTFLGDVFI